MTAFKHFISLLAIVLVSACTSPVHTDYETQHDFSQYSRYEWAGTDFTKDEYVEFGSDIFDSRLQRSVAQALASRGITEGSNEDSEFLIKYHLDTQERAYLTDDFNYGYFYLYGHPFYHSLYYPGMRRPFGMGFGGMGMAPPARQRFYTVGTITVQIEDKESARVVWTAKARTIMSQKRKPSDSEERLNELAVKMFKEFPPATLPAP